jgi:folate-dependent phosphoribosylglycinamide formyltransferase PurN
VKLVFLTTKCSYAADLLNHIKYRGIPIEAIIIERPNRYDIARFLMRRLGIPETARIIFKRLLALLVPSTKEIWLKDTFYNSHSNKVYTVNDLNGKKCERLLTELKPEIVALGYSPILRGNIIDIPKIGILNAHPGLLPKYRGINTIQWAVYNGDDIGVTVHFIDRGVDTGPIIEQKVIHVEQNDTIESLRKKADAAAAELLSDLIFRILKREQISAKPQLVSDGKQYHRMPGKLLCETKRRLEERVGKTSPINRFPPPF